jgi:hypothetical protein
MKKSKVPPKYVDYCEKEDALKLCGNEELTRDLACREQAVVIGMDNKKSCHYTTIFQQIQVPVNLFLNFLEFKK